jgi:hypothetical protein
MSKEDILNAKRHLLCEFDRLERRGVKLAKKFTLASSLDEMQLEYDRLKMDREIDASLRFQRQMLMTCVTGIEFVNNKFDPFDVKLDGWSEVVSENINDYDDIFEDLYKKYKGKVNIPPEIRLMFALGGSAVMFHFSKSMVKFGLEQALQSNPELVKQYAQAAVNNMETKKQGGGLFDNLGSLGNMFGMFFPSQPTNTTSRGPMPSQKTHMKGPSNVEDILKDLANQNNKQEPNERIEIISTLSESDMSDIPEDASVSGMLSRKKSTKARRTLDI